MSERLFIADSYYGDSHRYWADAVRHHPNYRVEIFGLTPRHWKYQMEAGAIELAQQINLHPKQADIIMATDMVNLPLLISLIQYSPIYWLYMHENQITYPKSDNDPDKGTKRDQRYGFINFTSCLCADRIIFNSTFHQHQLINALPTFLKQLPKNQLHEKLTSIEEKSDVIPLSMDTASYKSGLSSNRKTPTIVWNHRWDYDKNPQEFLSTLVRLQAENFDFSLILLGKMSVKMNVTFSEQFTILKSNIRYQGFATSKSDYISLLQQSDIVISTAHHEFFGVSVLEAMAAGCFPLLPKRLAYPELLDQSIHESCLYSESLYPALKALLECGNWKLNLSKQHSFIDEKYNPKQVLKLY